MKKTGIPLFNLAGFKVSLDWSWFFLAILITWSLAAGYFPAKYPHLTSLTYWTMGIVGAVGLFLSIILHEFCHSLVGRYYGMPIVGIKLFIFGGIAELGENPKGPKAEFMMAIVGPLFSILFSILLYFLFQLLTNMQVSSSITGVVDYLSIINFFLGVFNLLPGFPLDGGRVLRAILWGWKKDLKWATRIAVRGGVGLGFGMIFFGVFLFIQSASISGLWLILLGFYLQFISKSSYEQLVMSEIFHNEPVKKYVKQNPIAVSPSITVQELVDEYFYKHYHKLYPVVENGNLVGSISFDEIRAIPKENWAALRVSEVMKKSPSEIVIEAKTDLLAVLQIMTTEETGRLIVVENGVLYGIITLKDLMDIFSIKRGLESKR